MSRKLVGTIIIVLLAVGSLLLYNQWLLGENGHDSALLLDGSIAAEFVDDERQSLVHAENTSAWTKQGLSNDDTKPVTMRNQTDPSAEKVAINTNAPSTSEISRVSTNTTTTNGNPTRLSKNEMTEREQGDRKTSADVPGIRDRNASQTTLVGGFVSNQNLRNHTDTVDNGTPFEAGLTGNESPRNISTSGIITASPTTIGMAPESENKTSIGPKSNENRSNSPTTAISLGPKSNNPTAMSRPSINQTNSGGHHCLPNGFLEKMPDRFRQYYNKSTPKLRDAFADKGFFYALMNMKFLDRRWWAWKHADPWTCYFKGSDGGAPVVVKSTSEGRDLHRHSHMVTCKLPSPNVNVVTIIGTIAGLNQSIATEERIVYRDVPFCELPPPPAQPGLVMMCTSAQAEYLKGRLFDYWVGWHVHFGISKVVVYANEDPVHMSRLIESSPFKNLVELVDYSHPHESGGKDFFDQQSSQMSCLYRSRRRFQWIFLNDPDEFFFPIHNDSFAEFLKQFSLEQLKTLPALHICNKWHVPPQSSVRNRTRFGLTQYPGLATTASNKCKFRGKSFVQPEMVQYYSVHMVSSEQSMYYISENVSYLAHLAWKGSRSEIAMDNPAFAIKAQSVLAELNEWDFPNGTQLRKEYGFE